MKKTLLFSFALLSFGFSSAQNCSALQFDGVDDNISIASDSSLDLTSALTIEAWVYVTGAGSNGVQNVVCKSSSGANTGYIFPRTDDNWQNVTLYLNFNGAFSWTTWSASFSGYTNGWHHLAATYDGANINIYIDGVVKTTQAQTGAVLTNANPLTIGEQSGYGELFEGYADEIRIWNIARSGAEILAAMDSCLTGNENGLVAYYKLDDGTGSTTAADLSSNSNSGTLNNFNVSTAWIQETCCTPTSSSLGVPSATRRDPMPLVSPNPASEMLIIDRRNNSRDLTLSFYDMKGRLISGAIIAKGNQRSEISSSSFAPGTYLLSMEDGQSITRQRIVILR